MSKSTRNNNKNDGLVGSFETLTPQPQLLKLIDIYNTISENDEFEIMFNNYKKNINMLGFDSFLKVLEFITFRANKQQVDLKNTTSLDLIYSLAESNIAYRLTIETLPSINKYLEMLHLRRNHVIFSVLTGLADKDKNITLKKKIRNVDHIVDIDDFNIRVRKCQEIDIDKVELEQLKSLDETQRDTILFRYKQRVTYFLVDDDEVTIRIDLTNVKMSNNINKLDKVVPIYELEIDVTPKKSRLASSYITSIYKEITILLKILQQSNYLITQSNELEILNYYADLLGLNKNTTLSLDVRKPQSLEIQHAIDKLPNKYAVTDKADGERYIGIIHNSKFYIISDNLTVRYTGISNISEKYNGSIIDGEYIFIAKYNKYMFLAFDCLFHSGDDVRKMNLYTDRIQKLDDIINNCFIIKPQVGYQFVSFTGVFNMQKVLDFHSRVIDEYMNSINNDIKLDIHYPLIRRKYFIPALGAMNNEIFKYSQLIWNKYVYDTKTNCPYRLDGLMYHPLDQKYITSIKESKFAEYKWKPPEKNSIDFYIQFERSNETGKILIVYDNSRDEYIKGKPYKIANLYVGRLTRSGEQPTLFQRENGKHIAQLFVREGEVRDIDGNVVLDNTVVEFYYNNDPNIPEKQRWVPIRTRHDKSESVQRYNKKYGNYIDIANKIWRSIENPILISDIYTLAKDDSYSKHIDLLRSRIAHSVIMSEQQENEYYQKTTNLALPMRNFHNWIKSDIIYTYCNPIYEKGKQLKILDIGCGRGGDIMKFYYAKVDLYVGIDIDNNGLISPVNGAISRYNRLRRTHPNFPRMYFVNADAGTLLDYDEQNKIISNMTSQNRDIMTKFFSKNKQNRTVFDRINCQFAIHYLLANTTVWNNFIENIKLYLKPNGYMLITTFDADSVIQVLGDQEKFSAFYTDPNGNQELLFEIIKKFDKLPDDNIITPGYGIDVYNALILQEDNYVTEYLVQKDFLERELLEKCQLELIETDLFGNQFNIHEDYFKKYAVTEENEKTRKFLMNAAEYYNQKDEVNRASFQMTKLNRYYIFRRKDSSVKNPEKNIKMEGGSYNISNDYPFSEYTEFFNPNKFIKRDITGLDNYSFMESVYDVVKHHKLIPERISIMEFYKDIDFEMVPDNNLTKENINNLCDNLSIGHEYTNTDTKDVLLDGANIILISKDCDDDCTTDFCGKKGKFSLKTPSIILYKEDKYYPIFNKIKNRLIGMFDSKSTLIKNLRKNS